MRYKDLKGALLPHNIDDYEEVNHILVHKTLLKNLDRKIYRYMTFEYLLCTVKNSSLYLANRTRNDDKRESGSKINHKNYFPLSIVEPTKEQQEISTKWSHERWMKSYHACVSCWTSHANNERENYLMWKAYGSNGIGCMIKSTINNLIQSIKVDRRRKQTIILKDVEYRKERFADNNIEHYIFEKELAYSDEKELRLCVINKPKIARKKEIFPDHCNLKVDVRTLIGEIVISPFISNDYAQFHINQFNSMYPDYSDIIRKSDLLINTR